MANDSFVGEGLVASPFFKAMREIDILTTRIRKLEAERDSYKRTQEAMDANFETLEAKIERLQEEVAAMRAMLANPVGMVSAPSGTLPYKHLVRVREPLDAEIGCSLYAIRDAALAGEKP